MRMAIVALGFGWLAYYASKVMAGDIEPMLLMLLSLLFFLMAPLFALQSYLEAKRNV